MASIRERTSKGSVTSWAVLYRHGSRQTSMTFTTEKDALAFKTLVDTLGPDRAMKALDDGAPDVRLTVAELGEQFLAWKARDVTNRTMTEYRRDIRNYIDPWFGHRAAESIDEGDVQRWVDHMAGELAPKSVGDRHMLLHAMFQFGKARSRGLVGHNPCLETDLPRRHRRRPKGTTVPQFRAITAAARARNPDAADLIAFLGSVGWRFSEAIALPVHNVEQRHDGSVWVDMSRVFRIIENRQVLVDDAAKSYAGFRRVPVPSIEVGQMLQRRIVGKAPGDFVFTNARGRHWNQNTFLRETWPAIATDAGLWHGARKSPTPHYLRHMAVAVLAAAGASPTDIQRYIGHEDISTTMGTYGGMLGGLSSDVLANADRILAGDGPSGLVISGELADQLVAID